MNTPIAGPLITFWLTHLGREGADNPDFGLARPEARGACRDRGDKALFI